MQSLTSPHSIFWLSPAVVYRFVCCALRKCNCTTIDLCGPDSGHMHVWDIPPPLHFFSFFFSFPVLLSFHFLSYLPLTTTLLANPFSACRTGRQGGGSLAAYHAFRETTKGSNHVHTGSCATLLNSILCGISGDWHVLCPVWVSFICSEMRQLGRAFSLLQYEHGGQKRDVERQNERGDRNERGCHRLPTVARRKANVGACVLS